MNIAFGSRSARAVACLATLIVPAMALLAATPCRGAAAANAGVALTRRVLTDDRVEAAVAAELAEVRPGRRAGLPSSAALAEGRRAAHELFAAGYADKSPKGRLALAYDLYEKALAAKDDPDGTYVLLTEAREAAISVGDFHVGFNACLLLADRYELSVLGTFADLVNRMGPNTTKAQDAVRVAGLGMVEVAAQTQREEYADARQLIPVVRAVAVVGRDPTALARVKDRMARAEAAAADADRAQEAAAKLKANPNDPEANLVVGRYHCLTRGDFDKGIAFLSRGADADLKAVATADLAAGSASATAAARKSAGDQWWDQAGRETSANPVAADWCRSRAGYWYRQAEPGLAGLAKMLVQDRLATLPPPVVVARSATQPTAPPTSQPTAVASGPAPQGATSGDGSATVPRPDPAPTAPPSDPTAPPANAHTESLGKQTGGDPFEELAPKGGVLVGFTATLTTGKKPFVNRIQAIYSVDGKSVPGRVFGKNGGNPVTTVAKDGYAVGGLLGRSGLQVDGFACVFMKRKGDALDPNDSYVGDWVGGKGGNEKRIAWNGSPAIGLYGASGLWADRFGFVVAPPATAATPGR